MRYHPRRLCPDQRQGPLFRAAERLWVRTIGRSESHHLPVSRLGEYLEGLFGPPNCAGEQHLCRRPDSKRNELADRRRLRSRSSPAVKTADRLKRPPGIECPAHSELGLHPHS